MVRKGIDCKHNGYVVLQPSLNGEGYEYLWKNWGVIEPQVAPDWIYTLAQKLKPQMETGKASLSYQLGDTYLKKLVMELKKFEFSYDEWVQVGMALHEAMPSEHGLALYLEFTQNKSYNAGDLETAQEKWGTFSESDKESKITSASLIYLLKEKGGKIPRYDAGTQSMLQEQFETKIAEDMVQKPAWFEEEGRMVTYHKDFLVKAVNRMGYAFYPGGGAACIALMESNAKGEKKLKTFTEASFKQQIAPYFLKKLQAP